MLSYEQLAKVISRLKAVLTYRIDDPVGRRTDIAFQLDEALFFRQLYVPHPTLEGRCVELLKNYTFPVVISGKQGLGKTSVLEKVLRSIEEDPKSRLVVVRMRCNWSDRTYFEDLNGVIEYFRIALRSQMAHLRSSFFDIIADVYSDEDQLRYLEDSGDPAVKVFLSRVFEIYDSLAPHKRNSQPFMNWMAFSIKEREDAVCRAIETLRDHCSLSTQVSLLAISLGEGYNVLFSVDNVENLLDLAFIRNAFSLLMRSQNEIGEHARLVVATRPASNQATPGDRDKRYGDEGRNIFDPIDFDEFLEPVVVASEDAVFVESNGHPVMTAAVSRYIRLVERRINMLLEEIPAEEEIRAVFSAIEAFFARGKECTHVIAGLSNHSCRTVLVCVVNLLELALRDTDFMRSAFGLSITHDGEVGGIPGISLVKHIKEPYPSAALLNTFLFTAGQKGADMPGLILHRLDISGALSKYHSRGKIPYDLLSSFYILRSLNGCDYASFEGDQDESTIQRISVDDLVMRLAPFGFDRELIYDRCTALCHPDRWDQTSLAYATPDKNSKWQGAGAKDVVELESRGWMIANVLPFRFHYWRGNISKSHQDRGEWLPHGITLEQVLLVLRSVTEWAEVELKLVGEASRVLGSKSDVLASYREVTHFKGQTTWVFQAVLSSFAVHFRSLCSRVREQSPTSDDLKTLMECEAVVAKLADSLMKIANRVGGAELPSRWSLVRNPELGELSDLLWPRRER